MKRTAFYVLAPVTLVALLVLPAPTHLYAARSGSQLPAIAADVGGRIAFLSGRSGTMNVFVKDLVTEETRQVTFFPDGSGLTDPARVRWSADGKEIAFVARVPGQSFQVIVVGQDGTGLRQVTFPENGTFADSPVWHPSDPNVLFYQAIVPARTSETRRLDLTTGVRTRIPNAIGAGTHAFDITTDGTEMVFSREPGCCWSPTVFSGYQDLLGINYRILKPTDGILEVIGRINRIDDWILYFESTGGPYGPFALYKMDKDFQNVQRLTASGGDYRYPGWAGEDSNGYIVFYANLSGRADIYAMKADGSSGLINLTNDPTVDQWADWAPGGFNQPPVADAGPDFQVECQSSTGAQVVLDGSASSDPDGDTLTYTWTGPFPEGNGRVTGVSPTVTLPLGTSTVSLIVNDGTVDSPLDTAKVTVTVAVQGLLAPLAPLVPEDQPVALPDKAFKQGQTIPLRLRLACGGSPCLAGFQPPSIVRLVRSGEELDIDTLDLDAGNANDGGLAFRETDCQWVYNLSTKALAPGSYIITLEMPDRLHYDGGFVLRR